MRFINGAAILSAEPGINRVDDFERIAAICPRCDRANTHTFDNLKRGFYPPPPISTISDFLYPYCKARKHGGPCEVEIVSPDDGVADDG